MHNKSAQDFIAHSIGHVPGTKDYSDCDCEKSEDEEKKAKKLEEDISDMLLLNEERAEKAQKFQAELENLKTSAYLAGGKMAKLEKDQQKLKSTKEKLYNAAATHAKKANFHDKYLNDNLIVKGKPGFEHHDEKRMHHQQSAVKLRATADAISDHLSGNLKTKIHG